MPQQYKGYHDPVYDADELERKIAALDALDQAEAFDIGSPGDFAFDDLELLGVGLPTFYHGAGGPLDMIDLDPFLRMIQRAEHYPVDYASGMHYRTFYKGAKFSDLSDHPVLTGELQPIKLTRAQCIAAGIASGNCTSTAAGAYQINRPTWLRIRGKGAYLADFSPASQDEAARRLVGELGVPAMLEAGDFTGAVRAASRLWASLPGSTAGQGGKTFAQVSDYFRQAGGTLA